MKHLKMGKLEKTGRDGEKGEKLKEAINTALQLRVHCKAQSREGKNQVVVGIPLSQEDIRDLVSIAV